MNRELTAFASTHHGLITRSTAVRLGMSRSSWYRAATTGQLELLHPGVARLLGAPATPHQATLAAVWAVGRGAMASHRTFAWLWGVERPDDDPIDALVRYRGRHPHFEGVVLHRPVDLRDSRAIQLVGIPTTSPLRMLVDLGAVDPAAVPAAMEQILVARLAGPRAVKAALLRHAKQGRHGVGALRAAIDHYPFAVQIADSRLELRMAELVAGFGLPPVEFQRVVLGWEVDFVVAGTKVILECDGRSSHEYDPRQFDRDRVRDAELAAGGWIVVRFTWRQITREPGKVAARIADVLRRWA